MVELATKQTKVVYPELSYKLVGILFEVYNNLGSGYQEKYYQKAIASELKRTGIKFQEQVHYPIDYKDEILGDYYFDFLIEDKIVLEIKKDKRFSQKNITQVYAYLKASKLKLGILANFTKDGVEFKRIINVT